MSLYGPWGRPVMRKPVIVPAPESSGESSAGRL